MLGLLLAVESLDLPHLTALTDLLLVCDHGSLVSDFGHGLCETTLFTRLRFHHLLRGALIVSLEELLLLCDLVLRKGMHIVRSVVSGLVLDKPVRQCRLILVSREAVVR